MSKNTFFWKKGWIFGHKKWLSVAQRKRLKTHNRKWKNKTEMDARGLGNRGVRMQIKRRYNMGSRKKSGRYLRYRVLWERSVFNSTFCFWDYHIIMTFLPSPFSLSHFNKELFKAVIMKRLSRWCPAQFFIAITSWGYFSPFQVGMNSNLDLRMYISSWDSCHTILNKINKPI